MENNTKYIFFAMATYKTLSVNCKVLYSLLKYIQQIYTAGEISMIEYVMTHQQLMICTARFVAKGKYLNPVYNDTTIVEGLSCTFFAHHIFLRLQMVLQFILA